MKNKEKYKKEISKLRVVAFDNKTKTIKECYDTDCADCLFNKNSQEFNEARLCCTKWLESEHIEPYKLTENEVIELKYLMNVFEHEEIYCCDDGIWFAKGIEDKYLISRDLGSTYEHLNKSKTYSIEELLSNYEVVDNG